MSPFIPKSLWQEGLQGWHITDCAVRSSNIVYLIARQNIPDEQVSATWNHDIPTSFVVIYLDDDPDDALGWQGLDGFNHPRCGVARKPLPQGIIAARNLDGDVWAMGSELDGMEHIAPGKGPMTMKIKCINGYAYSVGSGRSIYKRTDIGHWVKLDNGFQEAPPNVEDLFADGFYDMDGFSETDMYAVGGKGDIWHYDGTTWMQEGFPSNMQGAVLD